MERRKMWWAILALAVLGMACSLGRGTPTPLVVTPPDEGGAAPLEDPVEEIPVGEASTVAVENRSNLDVCYLYAAPSEEEYWGDDLLGRSGFIEPGESDAFEVIGSPYDVLIQDCDKAVLDTRWEVEGDTTLVVGGEDLVPLRLINKSEETLCYIYIVEAGAETWGEGGWLGTLETVPERGEMRVFFVEPGRYDVMAQNCDGNLVMESFDVEVEGEGTQWTVTGEAYSTADELSADEGEGLAITVRNETPEDVCFVYIAPTVENSWGTDWLEGDEVIAPGEDVTFNVVDGLYDVNVVNCEGASLATAWDVAESITLRPGEGGERALEVINESGEVVCYFYVAPTSETAWGDNLLEGIETILEEGARIFYLPPDRYDLRAEDCNGGEIAVREDVDLTEEDVTWTLTPD